MNDFIKCPHCGTEIESSVKVCRGCGAEKVVGPTSDEAFGCGCVSAIAGSIATLYGIFNLTQVRDKDSVIGYTLAGGVAGIVVGIAIAYKIWRGYRFIRKYHQH